MCEGTRGRFEPILARSNSTSSNRNRDFEAGAVAYPGTKCHFAAQQINKAPNDGQSQPQTLSAVTFRIA